MQCTAPASTGTLTFPSDALAQLPTEVGGITATAHVQTTTMADDWPITLDALAPAVFDTSGMFWIVPVTLQ